MQRFVERRDRPPRSRSVRRLRVVDVAHAVDLRDLLEAVRHSRELAQRVGDLLLACARLSSSDQAAAAFSRLCSPGIRGSAGRASSAENSTRRARPGISPNPRGTTATSSGPWFSKMRSLASRYASQVPCRSRWSGSRFRSTAMRGRNSWMSSSWKLDSSQTIHAPAPSSSSVSARADVARHGRAEHLAEERGRGRLPVRPGHAEDRRVEEQPAAELDLAPDGNAALTSSADEGRLDGTPGLLIRTSTPSSNASLLGSEVDFDTGLGEPAGIGLRAVHGDDASPRRASATRPPGPSAPGRRRARHPTRSGRKAGK